MVLAEAQAEEDGKEIKDHRNFWQAFFRFPQNCKSEKCQAIMSDLYYVSDDHSTSTFLISLNFLLVRNTDFC